MKILWLDLETTGLDPRCRSIIEAAAVIDRNGKRLTVVNQLISDDVRMDGYYGWDKEAFEMHKKSGLLQQYHAFEVKKGMERDRMYTISDAESLIMQDILTDKDEPTFLGGNSVHFDRTFIQEYMPTLHQALHYRHIDVSCLTTFLQQAGMAKTENEKRHRAMDDIQYSIDTYYKYLDLARDWVRNDGLDNS